MEVFVRETWIVYACEQRGKTEWSRHRTRENAIRAAKRYFATNTHPGWVDHHGYWIECLETGEAVAYYGQPT